VPNINTFGDISVDEWTFLEVLTNREQHCVRLVVTIVCCSMLVVVDSIP